MKKVLAVGAILVLVGLLVTVQVSRIEQAAYRGATAALNDTTPAYREVLKLVRRVDQLKAVTDTLSRRVERIEGVVGRE